MVGREEAEPSQNRFPRGLTLEEARELEKGDAIFQLQRDVKSLTTSLVEVLARFRDDPGGGRSGTSGQQRDDLEKRKFDPSDFDGSLNADSYLEWVQSLERFFHFKEYSDEKAFKVAVPKLQGYASFWYENTKKQRARDGKSKIRTWTKLKQLMDKQFIPGTYKQKQHLRMSSLSQGDLREHSVSHMAESHPCKEKGKGKRMEVLKEIPRKREIQEEQEDEMIFLGPEEGELLELPEIHEEFLKEDELNQDLEPNKSTQIDVQENGAMEVLPLMEQSSLGSMLSPLQRTIESDLVQYKEVLKLEVSLNDYNQVFNELVGAKTYYFDYRRRTTPKIFKNSYMFKKGGVQSTLEPSQPECCTKFSWSLLGDKDSLYELLVDAGLEPLGFEDKSSPRGRILMHGIKG